jgi:Zn-finger nucleic acid-binding protein
VNGRDYLQCQYCLSLAFLTDNPLAVDRISPLAGEVHAGCPVCRDRQLQMGQLDEHRVLYCDGCYGVLVQNEDFGCLIRERRARRSVPEYSDVRPIDPRQYQRQLNCPNCRSRMEVHPYYGPGNIVIDSCSRCTLVWLDHGELACGERSAGSQAGISVAAARQAEQQAANAAVRSEVAPEKPRHALEILADLIF